MREFLIVLVLISGLVGGFFIGSHKGKECCKAVDIVKEDGKKLDSERIAVIARLEKEKADVIEKSKQDIEAINQKYTIKEHEWQRIKAGLNDEIKRQKAELYKFNVNIEDLRNKLANATTPEERERLKQEIGKWKKLSADLEKELEGNVCLTKQVPRSVINMLSGASKMGVK